VQEAEVSLYASHYLRSFIPSLWLYALLQCLQTWLQAQGINK
jgi:Na+-driven multidrug efflux pump